MPANFVGEGFMKRSFEVVSLLLLAVALLMAGQASAQWRGQNEGAPRDGACFYLDGGYTNQSFCVVAGQSVSRLPSGFNDQITAIRVFGRASVTVFEDGDFRGPSEVFDRSQSDLRYVRKRDDGSRVWSDRISSVRVDFARGGDRADWGRDRDDRGSGWDRDGDRDRGWNRDRDGDRDRDRGYDRGPRWGRGPQPRQGACFFRDTNFRGDYFCMARGESFRALPPGFNDRISSVRVFGGTRVFVFQDNDFRGAGARFHRDTTDLHDRRVRDSDRSWNDRVSSVRVD
jgi:hypothetical protein